MERTSSPLVTPKSAEYLNELSLEMGCMIILTFVLGIATGLLIWAVNVTDFVQVNNSSVMLTFFASALMIALYFYISYARAIFKSLKSSTVRTS